MTRAVTITVAILFTLVGAIDDPSALRADHSDGNMPGQVNYWLVEEGELRVCDGSNRVSNAVLSAAIGIWNAGLEAPILTSSCANAGVRLQDVVEDTCPDPSYGDAIACAEYPLLMDGSPQQRDLLVEPDAPTGNSAQMIDLITHELGHNLGFAHYPPTSEDCNEDSIMGAVLCPVPLGELKAIDITNYHYGYHVDAVGDFQGTSGGAGPHAVQLSWESDHLHNEREFLINWRNICTGQWQILETSPKNSDSITVDDVQGGLQEFQIVPLTYADPQHAPPYAGEARNVTVNVVAGISAPSGLASVLPSTTSNRFVWPAVGSADHYKIRTDVVPVGVFAPNCTGSISGTQYDAALPTQHQAAFYRRVMACNAADLCSALSAAYAVSERFDSGDWDYVFTYYRSLEDINLQFINFNPNQMALQIHVRNGETTGSPLVADSACIPANSVGAVGPMPASAFSTGKLATQGHGILNAGACATTHSSDSGTAAWGEIPAEAGACCGGGSNPGDLFTDGVYDILVGSESSALFHCIARADQAGTTVTSRSQCNIDVPGQGETGLVPPPWSDTCEDLEIADPGSCPEYTLNVPGETGPDLMVGPPPPPPYTLKAPSEGSGSYYASSGGPDECLDYPCTVQTICFEDVGSDLGIGPNIIWEAYFAASASTVDIYYNQTNANCTAGTPAGSPDFASKPITARLASGTDPAPWRPGPGGTTLDFDGDGCNDSDELSDPPASGCGDDPYNPSDSFDPSTVDLSGIYDIMMRIDRSDLGVPGEYMSCKADVQHETGTDAVAMPIYCYHDSVTAEINPEGYPGVDGDGFWGAPPPGPCSDGTCANGNYAFGDVAEIHAMLTGTFNKTTALVEIEGCLVDTVSGGSNHTFIDLTVSGHQLVGEADIWTNQTLANCQNGTPTGSPTHDDVDTFWARQPDGRDSDVDGVPDARELGEEFTCGQRDPFNQYDYYDVSIPRDGVIDLSNDILG